MVYFHAFMHEINFPDHGGFPLERGLAFGFHVYMCSSLKLRRSDLLGDLEQTTVLLFLFPNDKYAA